MTFRSSSLRLLTAVIAVVFLLLVPIATCDAAVSTPPSPTSSAQPDPAPDDLARALSESRPLLAKKEALFALRARAVATGDFRAYDAAATALNREIVGPAAQPVLHSPISASRAGVAQAASAFYGGVVGVTHVAQSAPNWCGPASGLMLVSEFQWAFGIGTLPSQDTMHSWMGTGPGGAGQPGTAITGFRNGLNQALGGAYYGVTTNLSQQGSTWYQNAITGNIDAQWSAGVNTTEPVRGAHYNGHPASLTVAHYIVAYAYGSYGAITNYKDPASGGSGLGWPSAQTFGYATTTFFNNFLNFNFSGRGLIW